MLEAIPGFLQAGCHWISSKQNSQVSVWWLSLTINCPAMLKFTSRTIIPAWVPTGPDRTLRKEFQTYLSDVK